MQKVAKSKIKNNQAQSHVQKVAKSKIKNNQFDKLFVQKSKGEIKKSMVLLFVMFTAVIAVSWGIFHKDTIASCAILMWGIGDAMAALIGIPFGHHKVHLPLTDGKKSWEGSIAMFIASFIVGLLVLLLTKEVVWYYAILLSGIGALIGAIVELFSPSEYDTITVPVAITTVLLVLVFVI